MLHVCTLFTCIRTGSSGYHLHSDNDVATFACMVQEHPPCLPVPLTSPPPLVDGTCTSNTVVNGLPVSHNAVRIVLARFHVYVFTEILWFGKIVVIVFFSLLFCFFIEIFLIINDLSLIEYISFESGCWCS